MSENPENGYTQVDDVETLDQGRPNVAATPGKMLIVVGGVAVIIFFLLYSIFSGGGSKDAPKVEKPIPVAPPIAEAPIVPDVPPLQAPPEVVIPVPAIPDRANLDLLQPEDNGAAKQQAMQRMQSKMMLVDGGGGGALGSLTGKDSAKSDLAAGALKDPNSAFAASVAAANTAADQITATRIGDLRHTIAQGRLIMATMESAMNTDLPAPVRAIVSRDTYAEAGHEPLIPKGSRLIGTYNTDVSGGQTRVFVIWTRVIRPDGVDVMIDSPLVDQIGQAGAAGQVDTKFQSIFSRSILSSVVSIAFAIGSDEISGGSTTTSNNGLGGSSTTGDAATTATINALSSLGSVSDNFIKRFIDARPTILVDQGTPVNVFVNHDLVFPAELSPNGAKIIN